MNRPPKATGGAAGQSITLSTSNLPNHAHKVRYESNSDYDMVVNNYSCVVKEAYWAIGKSSSVRYAYGGYTTWVGDNSPFWVDSIPPYYGAYLYKRTS